MRREYSVLLADRCIGSAQITTEGLYSHIQCTCKWMDREVYVLFAQGEQACMRIGVPIPCGNELALDTKIPTKRLIHNIRNMYLCVNGNEQIHQTACLEDGKPIGNLADILSAKLQFADSGAQLVYSVNQHKQDLE